MPASPYTDLQRPPLRQAALRRALVVPEGLWTDLRVVAETGSTNADVAELARAGAAEGLVLAAERQTAGRGRLDREWRSPARAGLTVSVLLRPGLATTDLAAVSPASYGWLPLLVGVALAEAVRRVAELDAVLKWPNDLLIDGRKCAGVLAEAVDGNAVVVGVGLNTSLREHELPRPDVTSLALSGGVNVDRDPLLRALLRSLSVWYGRWREHGGDPIESGLHEAYSYHSGTLGEQVGVELPDGARLTGEAVAIDLDGRLVIVDAAGERHPVAAGDIVHLR